MSFKNAVLNTEVEARTENGMKALKSSLNANVDLFFAIGASRGKDISKAFEKALQENREVALRTLQWVRDVRGGAGERELFRQNLKFLEKNYIELLTDGKLLTKVTELGRWDDLLIFETQTLKNLAYDMIKEALDAGNGLAAKWMPRKGKQAAELRNYFGWTPKFYRKRLVELSKNVVETKMCAKEWDGINFSHVPSLAMSRYTKAFAKNAPVAFNAYKEALKSGTAKVNASAVYPYDVIKTIRMGGDNTVADEQWKSLPNYMNDAMVLPMVDVSGSMKSHAGGNKNITCLDVAVSLGLYCSDKNTGPFKDLFLTFSRSPQFVHLTGTLSQKLRQMESSAWGMSTDLHAAFNEILKVAVQNKVSPEDMPKALLIMSDMQFDHCAHFDNSALEMIKCKYSDAGYELPGIVFWNLRACENVPVRFDQKGTALVSGFSPSIMKGVINADFSNVTPQGIMLSTVMDDRYTL